MYAAEPPADVLVGACESQVQFAHGAFAPVKDLKLLYVFNRGGTMTWSSNYDAAPPVDGSLQVPACCGRQ